MLSVVIFLPLFTALAILLAPGDHPRLVRWISLSGSVLTLAGALVLWAGYRPGEPGYQWRTTAPWIPDIASSYDVGVDGLSLPLIVLTALLLVLVALYVIGQQDRAKSHASLFLLMATGLMGVFASLDLLLFYVFFEVGLVPMYFIIGAWGHEDRRYAAMKYFLYTRAGSLAMLLSFLGLYLSMTPHTFSLPAIAAANPAAADPLVASLILLGLCIGFGVKLPSVPLHNWLPDAHVEAPTEGSVMLAGVLLKLGAYGFIRIVLQTVPDAAARYGWVLIALALASLVYGALAALAQQDLKRLIAYTSINHMGYVLLATGIFALSRDATIRQLAITGATFQMVSHGLLTGAMFFLVGILQDQTGTRDIARFGGLMRKIPLYSGLLGLVAFGSLGLPGLSGFVAEFQVIGAAVSLNLWVAVVTVVALLITTGLYLLVVTRVLMGEASPESTSTHELSAARLVVVGSLAALSLVLGIVPWILIAVIAPSALALAGVTA